MVDNHDDPTMPASTFRAWFIGTIFVAAGYVDDHHVLRTLPGGPGIHILTCCPVEGLSTSSSAFVGPVSQSQLMLLSCSPFPLESFWKRPSRPGSSPPSATPGVSTPAGSISRSTWSSLLWQMSGSLPHTLAMYVSSGFLRSSSARDRGSVDRLGPVPAALFQPAVRFQFRIPE